MQYFRLKTSEVKAIQLNWKNWDEICEFMGSAISKQNPARNIDSFHDKCGEKAPFIELTISNLRIEAVEGPEARFIAKHGDWIVEETEGCFYVFSPKAFKRIFEPVNLEKSDGGSSPSEQIMALVRIIGAIDAYEGLDMPYPTAKRMIALCGELKLYTEHLRDKLENYNALV